MGDLLARKPQARAVENWDDDFADLGQDDGDVFTSSVSSAGSLGQSRFMQRPVNLLSSFSEKQEGGEGMDGFDDPNLTRKISSLNLHRNQNNNQRQQHREVNDRSDGDDELDGDEHPTIRQRPKMRTIKSMKDFDNMFNKENDDPGAYDTFKLKGKKSTSILSQRFFQPPEQTQSQSRPKSPRKSPSKSQRPSRVENVEEGFDVEDDEPAMSLQQRLLRVKNRVHVDEEEADDSWGEESLGFRANSRLSEASASSSVLSSSYEESEHEGEDFLDGVELPERHVNFGEILETKQRDAQQVAEHEEELLMQGKKYDTIRSNGSGNSVKNMEALQNCEDEQDFDFFDGIEFGDAFNNSKNDMHKNIKVQDKPKKSTLDRATASPKKQQQQQQQQRADKSFDDISPSKRSATSSSRLRSVQSMSNVGARKPSAKPKFTRGKTRMFGDGTELDTLSELPTSVEREQSFTVTPKTMRGMGGGSGGGGGGGHLKHKPLDTYQEKQPPPKHKTVRPKQSKSQLPSSSSPTKKKKDTRRRREQKGPGLIQQLGPPTATIVSKGHSGDMRFNPHKLIWEGNDIELKKFDSINPKAPGLIAFISNKGVQVVGDMVFDPEKMCWIRVNGESEEKDPFEGVEDLDCSVQTTAPSMSTATSVKPSFASSVGGDFQVGDEFEVSPEMIKKMHHEDDRWYRKCSSWFSPDEAFDREYLYEIRQMVMK